MLLPARNNAPGGKVAEHVSPKQLCRQGTTVLVVDDDQGVRNFVRRVLTQMGYAVFLAVDGMEAVALYQQHQQRIHAVLLDVTMPKLDGYGTLSALRQLCPELPIIMTSGYAEQQLTACVIGNQWVSFVAKPFGISELLASVEAALERGRR